MSKRLFKISAVIALLLAVAVIRAAMEPRVDWRVFEQRLPEIFEASDFHLLHGPTEVDETVPLPFLHDWRSTLSWRASISSPAAGSPDSVSRWIFRRDKGSVLFCLARRHEGKIACMVISTGTTAELEARTMRDEVAKVFPHLKITLDICQPARTTPPLY